MDQAAHDFDLPESAFTIDHVSFATLVQALSCGVVITHPTRPDNPIVFVNRAFCRISGYAAAEVIGRDCNFLQGPETDLAVVAEIRASLNAGQSIRRSLLNYRKDGEIFWNDLIIDPVRNAAGKVIGFIGIQNDVTELRRAELARNELDTRLSDILENVKGYVLSRIMKPDGAMKYNYISKSFFKLIGVPEAGNTDPDFLRFVAPVDRKRVADAVRKSAHDLKPLSIEARLQAPGQPEHWVRSWSNVRRESNGDTAWDGFGIEITAEKRTEAQLAYLTYHDPLTNLPNRARLEAAIEHAVHESTHNATPFALYFADIAAFHEANETLGAETGDLIIRETAARLQHIAGPGAFVARIGGDEFAVLVSGIARPDTANRVAAAICRGLAEPILLDGRQPVSPFEAMLPGQDSYKIEVCVGIADFPFSSADMPAAAFSDPVSEYIKRCDVALYEAKRLGRGRYCQYSQEIDHKLRNRMVLRQSLHHAVAAHEFVLYYQPIVDLRSGAIVGAEALVRWNHPTLGLQAPDRFIPFAEDSGLIVPLGAWVLETAMRQMNQWQAAFGLARMAVNVSAKQISEPGFLETVARLLRETGTPAAAIDLELTEGTLIDFSPEMRERMDALRDLGLGISIDDFGTGYSSLKYLSAIPVNKIKIDRSFVRLMMNGESDASIIKAVILLGQTLSLEIVAEGIETPEQQRFLIAQGCRLGQGYLFSKPVPAEAFGALLAKAPPLSAAMRFRLPRSCNIQRIADMSTTGGSRFLKQPLAPSGDTGVGKRQTMQSRDILLREIQRFNSGNLLENQMFLVVVSAADIKRYDDIIRIFGYKFAEAMLTIRLEDLKSMLPAIDVYQVGFWSFGFIYDAAAMGDHKVFLDSLVEKLSRPVICRGIPIPIKAGVGVCDLRKDLGSSEDLLQSTFLAGLVSGTSAHEWISCKDEKDDHRRAFSLISDVFSALTTPDEFELNYQARIDLKTRGCTGVEALLRWRHPTLGVVSPGEFIPLVEMTGFIKPLTGWVLSKALAQTSAWHKRGYLLNVSVNISAKNLEELDFLPLLLEKLNYYGLAPKYLELEFTESSLFFDQVAARNKLQALRAIGVNIATDDFGTGHDSFTGLAANPANIIKIDRAHIATFSEGSRTQTIVKSMVTMAHDLGMIVVAEGVETGETLELLAKLSCDYAQGYFMCRPMLVEEFDAWYVKTYTDAAAI